MEQDAMVVIMPKSLRPGGGYPFAGGAPALLHRPPLSGVFASSSSGLKVEAGGTCVTVHL